MDERKKLNFESEPILLRREEVLRLVSVSKGTLYNLIAKSDFPKPRRIGARSARWFRGDIEAWAAAQPTT